MSRKNLYKNTFLNSHLNFKIGYLDSIDKTTTERHALEKKEIEKWKQGAEFAAKNENYLAFCKELSNTGLEVKEYD